MKISKIVERMVEKAFPTGSGLVSNWLIPGKVNRHDLLKRYEGYVYATVRPIASAVSKTEFLVNQVLADGTKKPFLNHPFIQLMDNPNPDMTKNQFLALAWTHKKVAGETFWYVVRGEQTLKPKEFHILRPDLVEVAVGRDENTNMPKIMGYVYTREGSGERIPLEKDEILHIREPNPLNPYRGLGAVEAGILYVMTEKYGAEFTRNYIANNAMPAGIVNIDGTIDGEEWKKLKRQFNNEYASSANAGKLFFMKNSKIGFTKVGASLADIDLKALKEMTRDDIMAMFGVSKPILGIYDDVNLASAKTAKYIFASEVVVNEVDMLTDALESELDRWTNAMTLELSYVSPVPDDEATELQEIKEGVNVYMTINEARARRKLKPIDGGDVLYLPFNVMPMTDMGATSATKALQGSQIRVEKKKMTATIRPTDQ